MSEWDWNPAFLVPLVATRRTTERPIQNPFYSKDFLRREGESGTCKVGNARCWVHHMDNTAHSLNSWRLLMELWICTLKMCTSVINQLTDSKISPASLSMPPKQQKRAANFALSAVRFRGPFCPPCPLCNLRSPPNFLRCIWSRICTVGLVRPSWSKGDDFS